jgi:hypothetical protein
VSQFFVYSKIWRGCTGRFIHENHEAIVALFTVILGVATWMLWRATRDLITGSEKISANQLRAYVYFQGFVSGANPDPADTNKIKEYVFVARIENVGLTPATAVRAWIDVQCFPMNEDRQPDEKKEMAGPATILGPGSTGLSSYRTVPIKTMEEKWRDETEIFIISRVEYRDTFNPEIIHHHQQCAMVDLLHEPNGIPPKGFMSYVSFRTYGPNSSG